MKQEPEYIECSALAKVGYPYTSRVLERGLEAIGWRYDINTDRWYPPAHTESLAELTAKFDKEFAKAGAKLGLNFQQPLTYPW